MLNVIAKNIIIKALEIRQEQGENPTEVLKNYKNLTAEEKAEILKALGS